MQALTATETPAAFAGNRLIRAPEVCWRIGLKKTALYDLIKAGRFPEADVRLSARMVAWRENTIEKWIADRVAETKVAA